MDFLLVTHEGAETLHTHPSGEACNVDDALAVSHLSASTAREFLDSGQAVACLHCKPFPEPPTLDTRGRAA